MVTGTTRVNSGVGQTNVHKDEDTEFIANGVDNKIRGRPQRLAILVPDEGNGVIPTAHGAGDLDQLAALDFFRKVKVQDLRFN